jgi:hypothetical protein
VNQIRQQKWTPLPEDIRKEGNRRALDFEAVTGKKRQDDLRDAMR